MASSSKTKKSKGRRNTETKMLEKEIARQVTFTKLSSNIVKQGNELRTLYGAEITLIFFSPEGQPFSYGDPSVIDRYLSDVKDTSEDAVVTAQCNARIAELNIEYNKALKKLEAEKKRGKQLAEERKDNNSKYWWDRPVDELSLEQLETLVLRLGELKIQLKD
ncbi:hypothetical protein C5167_009928 [Papaver somniferum]|uniref:MADS-box domain-containing protein n=1 Tax=Papaver somniferum TaxID=3469 RepID=A0A4Y7K082_PAPSO|nr:agamous-like MADS-box protein AGL61 [Papaver somniferum]RZC66236.1 hypothetical protein C5167_009928 [Papaver somniferum]